MNEAHYEVLDEVQVEQSSSASAEQTAVLLLCSYPNNEAHDETNNGEGLAETVYSAKQLARLLVEERLAAGVNILQTMHSVYRWQGTVEAADEQLLLIETSKAQVAAVTQWLITRHPYELPKIITVPITGGLNHYLAWINSNSR